MNEQRSQRGFSLVEMLIVAAVVAIAGAIAVASFSSASNTSALRTTFVDAAAAIKRTALRAMGGSAERFSVARDAGLPDGFAVNPEGIPAPPGTERVSEIEFDGGSGDVRANGHRAVVSVVIAERGRSDFAYAIVAGTAGRVELRTYSDGTWREFQ